MITNSVRIKLVAFAVTAALSLAYGLTQLLPVIDLIRPPMTVNALFADPDGIYPQADVDVMGVQVGKVAEVLPGPGTLTTVVMHIDRDAQVPADVRAVASAKSAIGEQFINLVPKSSGGRTLAEGDVIPVGRSVSPPDLATLIGDLEALASSVPLEAVRTTLREGSLALEGLAPDLQRILDDSDQLSASAARNADDLTALIDNAQQVLLTQIELGEPTTAAAADLASLTTTLRQLDPTFDSVFVNGIVAGTEVTGLLRDNQEALPVLLNNLLSLTTLAAGQVPAIRKSLVVFPWALEYNSQALRYCDKVDPRTGKPQQDTCHYDEFGLPIWSAHIADVVKVRGDKPYNPCLRGYESTKRYKPNGEPADGKGPRQKPDASPNFKVRCLAPPTDPDTPNVRGFQNIPSGVTGSKARGEAQFSRSAMLNPSSGTLVAPGLPAVQLTSLQRPAPRDGSADLGWLLTQNLTD